MADALEESFGLRARWVEDASRNTHENAHLSAPILLGDGIRRVYLVTHFWHMPRAMAAVRASGLEPVAAPVGLAIPDEDWSAFLPRPGALRLNQLFWHETVGRLWYRLRYGY